MSAEEEPYLERIRAFLKTHGLPLEADRLACQALTHRSYAAENGDMPDNERLEFLGDAVIGAVAADFVFHHFPDDPEGALSKKKGFLVSRSELAKRAEEIALGDLVRLGRGEESSGGRRRASILGSALEALVGALCRVRPIDEVRPFLRRRILEPGLAGLDNQAHLDAKSRLQEIAQQRGWDVPTYRKTDESGPPHARTFTVEVYVQERRMGVGSGRRIKTAEDRAARQAYENLMPDLNRSES